MDHTHARPDLSWVPYPVHLSPPPSAYLHIVVVEATSARHPKPGSSRTALYIVPLLPPAPLQVGQYVHLHLLCSTTPDDAGPGNMDKAVAVPLPVAGRLEGERMQHAGEMEFVLKNEIAEASVKNAVIRIRHVPEVSVRAGLAGALEKKLRQLEVLRPHEYLEEEEGEASRSRQSYSLSPTPELELDDDPVPVRPAAFTYWNAPATYT
ncbi:hypothetical protein TRAPUB_8261 [Trametes pubescens]|uniref:Uncharacterized protein n=1 Tax=Trametes pubescens TaxID=154538 RepID=A0A1M2W5P8_TRAPU|nr:hypothetical protein TRAPUB_8261 [Trametes pubescens]